MPAYYYELLGLDRTASPEEIKQAYRRLAFKCHPDHNPGAEEQFIELHRAYAVLSKANERERYDGSIGPVEQPPPEPPPPGMDYYEVLGVARSAPLKDIVDAFRKHTDGYRPAVKGGDPIAQERYSLILNAYRVLGDAESRRQYDLADQGIHVNGIPTGQR